MKVLAIEQFADAGRIDGLAGPGRAVGLLIDDPGGEVYRAGREGRLVIAQHHKGSHAGTDR